MRCWVNDNVSMPTPESKGVPGELLAASREKAFDTVPVPPDLPAGWTLVTATTDQTSEAERVEYHVFLEIGFCERSEHERALEFDPWRDESIFKVVLDHTDRIRGVVRLLVGEYDHLPIGSFRRDRVYPPDPVLEYASLAVPANERNLGVAEALYRGVWQEALRRGTSGMVAIGADWLLGILNETYDLGFVQLGPGRYYMGSHCIPVGTDFTTLLERLKRQPSFFRWAVSELDLRDIPDSTVQHAVSDLRQ